MRSELPHPVEQLFETFVRIALVDVNVRDQLRGFAEWLHACVENMPQVEGSTPNADGVSGLFGASSYAGMTRSPAPSYRPGSLFKQGPMMGMVPGMIREQPGMNSMGIPSSTVAGWLAQAPNDEDLPTIEQRCRLKAEASRWAGERQRLLKDGADFHTEVEPRDREVIGRAKALPECFLWMNHKDGPIPRDLSIYDDLAGAFETTAYAISLLRSMLRVANEERDLFEQVLQLTAEAQSCVRGGVIGIDGKPDRDQMKIFYWLRAAGAQYQILIRRYMRQDDIADFRSWPDVRRRIEEIESKVGQLQNREKHLKLQFFKVKHLSRRLTEEPEKSEDIVGDYAELIRTVDDLVIGGLPSDNKDMREMLLPLIDQIPEELPGMTELPKNFATVLRTIDHDRTLAGDVVVATDDEEPSEEVAKVAELLKGQSLALIAGDRRPAIEDAIVNAFGLSELIWVETREHQTHAIFEPHMTNPEIAAIVLATRWSSHGYAEVKEFCERYNKMLVKLPGNYSINILAKQILNQAGERLAVGR